MDKPDDNLERRKPMETEPARGENEQLSSLLENIRRELLNQQIRGGFLDQSLLAAWKHLRSGDAVPASSLKNYPALVQELKYCGMDEESCKSSSRPQPVNLNEAQTERSMSTKRLAKVFVGVVVIAIIAASAMHNDRSKQPTQEPKLTQEAPAPSISRSSATPASPAVTPSPPQPALPPIPLEEVEPMKLSSREIADMAIPATIVILADDCVSDEASQGTGFFVSSDLIATCYHVVEGAQCITVSPVTDFSIRKQARLMHADIKNDLALLRVTGLNATPLLIGELGYNIGDQVYVVGNPDGLAGTFSAGVVSGFRKFDQERRLQISAPISKGSSGGPVLNEYGQVIGLSAFIYTQGQNLNFAIPSSYLSELLLDYARARRVKEKATMR